MVFFWKNNLQEWCLVLVCLVSGARDKRYSGTGVIILNSNLELMKVGKKFCAEEVPPKLTLGARYTRVEGYNFSTT